MVAATRMGWFSDMGTLFKDQCIKFSNPDPSTNLGILAFETAKIMSHLVATYASLSDQEFQKLKYEVTYSDGVTFLNSSDNKFLLSLACAERLEDLDSIAVAVARLGQRCSDYDLNRFDLVYTNLKFGSIDIDKLEYGSRYIEKQIEKMERLIYATNNLYASLEGLAELEITERKLHKWRNGCVAVKGQKINFQIFDKKIAFERKQVRYFKETSLWSQTFDASVGLMARLTCIIYARICKIFKPYVPVFPCLKALNSPQQEVIMKFPPKHSLVRFDDKKSIFFVDEALGNGDRKKNRVFHAAEQTTVGGSGLALHYANLILQADKYLNLSTTIGREEQENFYEMLPENLKLCVRSKLSKHVKRAQIDESLSEWWRQSLEAMMRWLVPMARNTVRWQMERKYEGMNFETRTPVMLVQTLHFSDKDKTEAAIAQLMFGLSCIYRHERRRTY